jgi:hypothetical protein
LNRRVSERSWSWFLDALAIACLAAALIWPMFTLGYRSDWSSIESTFIADGRFLGEHFPPAQWQPNWYCGTRTSYIYPPLLRYGTMIAAKLTGWPEVRSYHFYTSLLFTLGIVGVYFFVRVAGESRAVAWLAAVAALVLSPSLLLLESFQEDSAARFGMPVRLSVLLIYGEGPHMSSLALLFPAMAAAWAALRKHCNAALAIAAILCAGVVGHNFYGATALAMIFPLVVWAIWVTDGGWQVWVRAAEIAVLSFGMCASWLTPSYIAITRRNLAIVAQPGNLWSVGVMLLLAAFFVLLSWRWARGHPERAWPVFAAGFAAFFSLNIWGNYHFGFRVTGEPLRLVPEFDLALIFLCAEALRRLWGQAWWRRAAAAAIVLAAFYPSLGFVKRAWTFYGEEPDYRERVEYRVTRWMKENMPEARALTTGSVRFWYNTWDSLPQIGGGSEQGLINMNSLWSTMEAAGGSNPDMALAWLQAVGADAAIVHDETSQEVYHDYPFPEKFESMGSPVFDDGAGNFIYRVPRNTPGIAHVVRWDRIRGLKPPESTIDYTNVRAYADAVESGRAAQLERAHPDRFTVRAILEPEEALLLQESFDPSWRASSSGEPLRVAPDAMGFMVVDAPPGTHEIRMEFFTPPEVWVGRVLLLISLGVLVWLPGRRGVRS